MFFPHTAQRFKSHSEGNTLPKAHGLLCQPNGRFAPHPPTPHVTAAAAASRSFQRYMRCKCEMVEGRTLLFFFAHDCRCRRLCFICPDMLSHSFPN